MSLNDQILHLSDPRERILEEIEMDTWRGKNKELQDMNADALHQWKDSREERMNKDLEDSISMAKDYYRQKLLSDDDSDDNYDDNDYLQNSNAIEHNAGNVPYESIIEDDDDGDDDDAVADDNDNDDDDDDDLVNLLSDNTRVSGSPRVLKRTSARVSSRVNLPQRPAVVRQAKPRVHHTRDLEDLLVPHSSFPRQQS